eukprot:6115262-Prymnesium_polylepis.1
MLRCANWHSGDHDALCLADGLANDNAIPFKRRYANHALTVREKCPREPGSTSFVIFTPIIAHDIGDATVDAPSLYSPQNCKEGQSAVRAVRQSDICASPSKYSSTADAARASATATGSIGSARPSD